MSSYEIFGGAGSNPPAPHGFALNHAASRSRSSSSDDAKIATRGCTIRGPRAQYSNRKASEQSTGLRKVRKETKRDTKNFREVSGNRAESKWRGVEKLLKNVQLDLGPIVLIEVVRISLEESCRGLEKVASTRRPI